VADVYVSPDVQDSVVKHEILPCVLTATNAAKDRLQVSRDRLMIFGILAAAKLLYLPLRCDTFLCNLADKIAVLITYEEVPKSVRTQGLVGPWVIGRLPTDLLHDVHDAVTMLYDETG
jgi:hypothetical protein